MFFSLFSLTEVCASVDKFDLMIFCPSRAIAEDAFDAVSLDFSGDSDSTTSLIVKVVVYIFVLTTLN